MASTSEYGGIASSMLTYHPYKPLIETISALLLVYPIIEEEFSMYGVTLHFFEKALFGKKQKGYLKLEYLPGKHIDIQNKLDEQGDPLPLYTDLLIGIEYGSTYNSVNWSQQHRRLSITSPNKQVLSYGLILENIQFHKNIQNKIILEMIQEGASNNWGAPALQHIGFPEREVGLLNRVESVFDVFKKFQNQSNFQPAILSQ